MIKSEHLTQQQFEKFLAWLDAEPEKAGEKYENIRRGLISMFIWRGFNQAEDLADEVLDRVIRKIDWIAEEYKGEPLHYFHGVARWVIIEHQRGLVRSAASDSVKTPSTEQEDVSNQEDLKLNCLDSCLQRLSPEHRDLIRLYYQKEKQAKIDSRKELSEQMGITANTLRVQVHRIRTRLEKCMEKCLKQDTLK